MQNLLKGDYAKAKETAQRYKDLFGDDYYIELQDHNLEDQKRTNPDLIKIAKELNIKMIITNDSHYLRREDADVYKRQVFYDISVCLIIVKVIILQLA